MFRCGAQRNCNEERLQVRCRGEETEVLVQTLRDEARWIPALPGLRVQQKEETGAGIQARSPARVLALPALTCGWQNMPILALSKHNFKVDLFFF